MKKLRVVVRLAPEVVEQLHQLADRFGLEGTGTAVAQLVTALHGQPGLLEALLAGRAHLWGATVAPHLWGATAAPHLWGAPVAPHLWARPTDEPDTGSDRL